MEHFGALKEICMQLDALLEDMQADQSTMILNQLSVYVSQKGEFGQEPVSAVQWIPGELVVGNDYNPNNIAPPELNLLVHSMMTDGFTQPLVVSPLDNGHYELIDGFHRHQISMEEPVLKKRYNGYVPVVTVKKDSNREGRIAATVRHNRARGRHQIQAMSALVQELTRLGWDAPRIAKELGMEPDEVLRLSQINGLAEMFRGRTYSEAWTSR
ncbi:IbrB-like domain-containing protein [Dryocola sp. BD586]|uniref:IbrB-like domain-containing protein n=1 Tax=Dryocola sp. BD586 TaxID=3133271 RepID=UPI003F503BAB